MIDAALARMAQARRVLAAKPRRPRPHLHYVWRFSKIPGIVRHLVQCGCGLALVTDATADVLEAARSTKGKIPGLVAELGLPAYVP